MSEAVSRFAALLQLSDKMLKRAERKDIEECIRLLAVYCAEYRSKFGVMPFTGTLDCFQGKRLTTIRPRGWQAGGKSLLECWTLLRNSTRKTEREVSQPAIVLAMAMYNLRMKPRARGK